MKMARCENDHFYDAERFESCPHCNQPSISTVIQDPNKGSMYTEDVLKELIDDAKGGGGAQKTIGYFGEIPVEPVVGWLVAIEGSNYGESFKLKSGRNYIGRSAQMDIVLTKDNSISREKHAIVIYEPKGNIFLVQPGDAKELFYLNDNVVLTVTEIKAYDVLSLGGTKLLFIPCCSDKFNWDSVKPEKDKK